MTVAAGQPTFIRSDKVILAGGVFNSGILAGGQFASGGLGHVALQWRKVGISGPVTIIDNVLSIKTSGPATSPVTIANVTFG